MYKIKKLYISLRKKELLRNDNTILNLKKVGKKMKYVLVYYLKNGTLGMEYCTSKKNANKRLLFYLNNSNYASAEIYKIDKVKK